MNKLQLSFLVLCYGTLASCAHSFTQPPAAAHASVGDFTDYVLEPLALRVADEKIMEAGAGLRLARTPKGTMQSVAGLLQDVPWVGRLLNFSTASQKAHQTGIGRRRAALRKPLKVSPGRRRLGQWTRT